MKTLSFIQSIKEEQPHLWQIILSAANEELIIIDEENDALTATNRLLLTYPGLHDVLAFITDQWTETHLRHNTALSELLHQFSAPGKN